MSMRRNNFSRFSRLLSLVLRSILCGLFLGLSSFVFSQAARSTDSSNYEELLKSANLAYETGDFNRAIIEFSVLYDAFPEDPSISNNYAVALFKGGQHADAAAVIQTFLSDHSEVGEITSNLFTIYDYMASESYALLNGVEPSLPDLRLSDSAPNIEAGEPSSNSKPIVENIRTEISSRVSTTGNQTSSERQVNEVTQENDDRILLSPAMGDISTPISQQEAELIEARLNEYIQAWSDGDVNQYLSFYYPNTSPVAGVSFDDWYQSRIERIYPEREIELSIEQLGLHFESEEDLILEYIQRYRSLNYSDRTLKQMRWQKYQGIWYIRNEKSLPR